MKSFSKTNNQYARAINSIPLASQTFSKSALNFVQGATPLFLDRGEGCHVWDIDGNQYIDYVIGLLPIVLGYKDPDVDDSIRKQLAKGISFSLATTLETDLAERLIELIPCAEMVRYGKNGSDVTSAAIRLARAYTGREKILTCGYHGWHDWYIGSTSRDLGVPKGVKKLTSSIPFGNIDTLEKEMKDNAGNFAALIIEPVDHSEYDKDFLSRARELTSETSTVLIFDEIRSGFRIDIGGAQKYYGITPDLACFGKAMGNGMPISAIVGKKNIMKLMEEIFFSGTFGGETLSLAAAIATIDKLKKTKAIEQLKRMGSQLKKDITFILERNNINEFVQIVGPDWKPFLQSQDYDKIPISSLLRQELVAAGLLMGGTVGLCLAHCREDELNSTLKAWNLAAENLSNILKQPDPSDSLRGKPIQPVFKVR